MADYEVPWIPFGNKISETHKKRKQHDLLFNFAT